ncbi:MAG: hypothetical protein EP343_25625 [Deltaproteobacteria bacterium]|nr:MAG: hypothetical protein EP343_25625 [Deltaproteobacteria bacterium]
MFRVFVSLCIASFTLGALCADNSYAKPRSTRANKTRKLSKKKTQPTTSKSLSRWKAYKKKKRTLKVTGAIVVNGRRQVPKVVYVLNRTAFQSKNRKIKPKSLVRRVVNSVSTAPF